MTPRIINVGIATLADKNLPNKRGNPIPATASDPSQRPRQEVRLNTSCRNVLAVFENGF
jgi:hypothetical protein